MTRPIAFALALTVTIAACGDSSKSDKPAAAQPAAAAPEATPVPPGPGLLHPDVAKTSAIGPDSFVVHVVSSKGPFDITVHRDWAPRGSDRLYYLVSNDFFDGIRFYRVIQGFMAQFGAAGDPAVAAAWDKLQIPDDPVKHSNARGTLTFATAGPNTRTTQFFINFNANAQLDQSGFAPVGQVTKGMNVVDSLYNGYGEGGDMGGRGPLQGRLRTEGNTYLEKEFPKLDYIVTARVSNEWKQAK